MKVSVLYASTMEDLSVTNMVAHTNNHKKKLIQLESWGIIKEIKGTGIRVLM